jgi:hypothetical protein
MEKGFAVWDDGLPPRLRSEFNTNRCSAVGTRAKAGWFRSWVQDSTSMGSAKPKSILFAFTPLLNTNELVTIVRVTCLSVKLVRARITEYAWGVSSDSFGRDRFLN